MKLTRLSKKITISYKIVECNLAIHELARIFFKFEVFVGRESLSTWQTAYQADVVN